MQVVVFVYWIPTYPGTLLVRRSHKDKLALQVMDIFLYEGPNILFPVALSVLKMNEKLILETDDGMLISNQLRYVSEGLQ